MSDIINQIIDDQTVMGFVAPTPKVKKLRKYKIEIVYPTNDTAFTISDLISLNGGNIHRVTVQQRINKELAKGFLNKTGTLELERPGRPEALYKVV